MTLRVDSAILQSMRLLRGKTLASLFRIGRRDGVVVRFTDHDRPLELDGETYEPINLGSVSAERREAGLRSGNQEATGIIDGVAVTLPDLRADRYRGALVSQRIVDWRMPWAVHYAAVKTIRQMKFDGSRYVATLEGLAARLSRPVGGRFGGTFATTCPYTLGDPLTCRAEIGGDTITNVRVGAVVDDRMKVKFEEMDGPNVETDDYYRDGEIEWTLGNNAGHVSPIVEYIGVDRETTFLFPTPFPIEVNDEGTVRPGCDGLKSTCIAKFDNVENFGGDPYAPGAGKVLESPG